MINIDKVSCLDVETHHTAKGDPRFCALQPFRFRSKEAVLGSIAVCNKDSARQITDAQGDLVADQVTDFISALFGEVVVAHNAVFDVAWLIMYSGYDNAKRIKWLDTMLLAKWVENSQAREFAKKEDKEDTGLDLAGLVKRYIPEYEGASEFLTMKGTDEALTNRDYWDRRGVEDVRMTLALFKKLWSLLPESQRAGYLIECSCIAAVANSWMQGIQFNIEGANAIRPRIADAKANLMKSLGFSDPKQITSSTQLGRYLFSDLGLPAQGLTGTGKPSASAENLKFLHYELTQKGDTHNAGVIQRILEFKQIATLESKYLNGFQKVFDNVGVAVSHSSPRIFGTYTGRFTYASNTKRVHQIGIATHQIPRKGPVRKLLTAPEGYVIAELDAAGQESRLMAIKSRDPNMLEVFKNKKDLHSMTGARIAGVPYDEFMDKFHNGDKHISHMRYCGKFVNLSCNYRIGDAALGKKAFVQYGIVISKAVAKQWNDLFKFTYGQVPAYWKSVVHKSKIDGYTETLGGRRFYLTDWAKYAWATESSAINHPIQGTGADMKTLAISTIAQKFPEAIFILDLHDGLFYLLPEGQAEEMLFEMRQTLNSLPYNAAWGAEPEIPLLWDASYGDSFGTLKEIDWKSMYGAA